MTANTEVFRKDTRAGLCLFGVDLELLINNWLGKLRCRLFRNNRFSI